MHSACALKRNRHKVGIVSGRSKLLRLAGTRARHGMGADRVTVLTMLGSSFRSDNGAEAGIAFMALRWQSPTDAKTATMCRLTLTLTLPRLPWPSDGWRAWHGTNAGQGKMDPRFADCWFLTGPTASGKSVVALELAERIGAEIISLDSMAVYRKMDIGTAKPTPDQRARVPHHMIDIVDPDEEFSVATYVEGAARCVEQITQRGHTALFTGGTPLYLKSLLRGMFEGPPADWDFRNAIQRELKEVGVEALHQRLAQIDPLSADKLPPTDVRRIIRALEVYKITNRPISHWQMQFDDGIPAEQCRVFVLAWPRPILHQRISDRVDAMFAEGLVHEVRDLQQSFEALSRTAMQAVGYREVMQFLASQERLAQAGPALDSYPTPKSTVPAAPGNRGPEIVNLSQAIERVKTRTRRFAKRQETWFRSLTECRFMAQQSEQPAAQVAETIVATASASRP